MSTVHLDLACGDYDRVRALREGSVRPEGIDLNLIPFRRPEETFWRMLVHREFHAAEMSFGGYVAARSRGESPFIAIPVFPSRFFRHSAIYVNVDARIARPVDLRGKRVGVPEYQQTAAVWVRGILQDEYGVHPSDVEWHIGGQEHPGRRDKLRYALPADVRVERILDGKMLAPMLEAGEIDALVTPLMPSPFLRRSPRVRRLFADYRAVEADYYRRTGIFPIMHTIVLRQEVYAQHPWIAQSLYKAFDEAKQRCLEPLYDTGALLYTLPWLVEEYEQARDLMGDDYWPYGLKANRTTLETFVRYAHEQGIAARPLAIEELFAAETLETFRI
jgi:4,5-dihydroxyphthalate decarboxylase